jgi:hypothetical protein
MYAVGMGLGLCGGNAPELMSFSVRVIIHRGVVGVIRVRIYSQGSYGSESAARGHKGQNLLPGVIRVRMCSQGSQGSESTPKGHKGQNLLPVTSSQFGMSRVMVLPEGNSVMLSTSDNHL